MANTAFMQKKFSLENLVLNYLNDIKGLKPLLQSPMEERKLQAYYQAAKIFQNIAIKELVQFIMSFGKNSGLQANQMRNALPVILGNRVSQPSKIDLEYARLLLEYARSFAAHKQNLSNWLLRFVVSSRFSPVQGLIDQEIAKVIEDTERKRIAYEAMF